MTLLTSVLVYGQTGNTVSLNDVEFSLDTLFHAEVGPGTTQTSLRLMSTEGTKQLRVFYLTIDLTNPVIDIEAIVGNDKLSGGQTVSGMASSHSTETKDYYVGINTDFFVTNQRYDAFKTTMAEKYPNIEIVSEQGFLDEGTCNIQGDAIMTQYPDIDAIFCHWDIPCEGVLSSVRAAGKSPLLSTIDLGNNIALEIASGNVLGLGAQRPYDQGVAEAMCAAYSLLGKEAPAYVAVAALRVDQSNILEAYSEVYYVDAPDWLVEAYEANQG